MRFFRILMMVMGCLCCQQNCQANDSQTPDSILYHLKLINGNKVSDSLHFFQVLRLFFVEDSAVLPANPAVTAELQRIEKVLPEEEYYNLVSMIYNSRVVSGKVPNDELIEYGKAYIDAHKNSRTGIYGRQAFLTILREMRVPFRNSKRIYEGIEYYSLLNKEFLNKKDSDAVTICYNVLAGIYNRLGLQENARYNMLKSIEYLDDTQISPNSGGIMAVLGKAGKANRYSVLGTYALDAGKPEQAEVYVRESIKQYKELKAPMSFLDGPFIFMMMAICKSDLKNDSSTFYFNETFNYLNVYHASKLEYAFFYMHKGAYFLDRKILDSAELYIRKSISLKDSFQLPVMSPWGELSPYYYLASIKMQVGKPREAIRILLPEINALKELNTRRLLIKEYRLLSTAYAAAGMYKESLVSLNEIISLNEAMGKEVEAAKSVSFEIEKKMQQDDLSIASLKAQNDNNRKSRYYLYGISVLLGLFATTLAFAIFNKQKSNIRLKEKNSEISGTLQQLKDTQSQLIQSEKMASLGELTAGIAHEIQNPLNFVTNFSEVNVELITELEQGISTGNFEEVKSIANDIRENELKINHHGKRADAIVKGMLQHSKNSVGEKIPTDINALADEYLRLAYHGFRAKEKGANILIQTDFDSTIGKLTVIPQDIGRVLLNLYNNAFYAVAQMKKQVGVNAEPIVSVSTGMIGKNVVISVKDNGAGIPEKIRDKIFQPFFTTKPTGMGTGLGLSLSYDIIKAHGGSLSVESQEGEGARFTINLPVN